jgi:hypothetical protein
LDKKSEHRNKTTSKRGCLRNVYAGSQDEKLAACRLQHSVGRYSSAILDV